MEPSLPVGGPSRGSFTRYVRTGAVCPGAWRDRCGLVDQPGGGWRRSDPCAAVAKGRLVSRGRRWPRMRRSGQLYEPAASRAVLDGRPLTGDPLDARPVGLAAPGSGLAEVEIFDAGRAQALPSSTETLPPGLLNARLRRPDMALCRLGGAGLWPPAPLSRGSKGGGGVLERRCTSP